MIFLAIPVAFFVIFTNAIVFLAILKSNRLQTLKNVPLVGLATADILVGACWVPLAIANHYLPGNKKICQASLSFEILTMHASLFNLVAVSMERWIAIFRPLHYHYIANKYRMVVLLLIAWSMSLLMLILFFFAKKDTYSSNNCHIAKYIDKWFLFVMSAIFHAVCLLMIFMQRKVYLVIRNQMRKITPGELYQMQTRTIPIDSFTNKETSRTNNLHNNGQKLTKALQNYRIDNDQDRSGNMNLFTLDSQLRKQSSTTSTAMSRNKIISERIEQRLLERAANAKKNKMLNRPSSRSVYNKKTEEIVQKSTYTENFNPTGENTQVRDMKITDVRRKISSSIDHSTKKYSVEELPLNAIQVISAENVIQNRSSYIGNWTSNGCRSTQRTGSLPSQEMNEGDASVNPTQTPFNSINVHDKNKDLKQKAGEHINHLDLAGPSQEHQSINTCSLNDCYSKCLLHSHSTCITCISHDASRDTLVGSTLVVDDEPNIRASQTGLPMEAKIIAYRVEEKTKPTMGAFSPSNFKRSHTSCNETAGIEAIPRRFKNEIKADRVLRTESNKNSTSGLEMKNTLKLNKFGLKNSSFENQSNVLGSNDDENGVSEDKLDKLLFMSRAAQGKEDDRIRQNRKLLKPMIRQERLQGKSNNENGLSIDTEMKSEKKDINEDINLKREHNNIMTNNYPSRKHYLDPIDETKTNSKSLKRMRQRRLERAQHTAKTTEKQLRFHQNDIVDKLDMTNKRNTLSSLVRVLVSISAKRKNDFTRAMTTNLVCLLFVIMWIPKLMIDLLTGLELCYNCSLIQGLPELLGWTNSGINALIYAWRMKEFKDVIRQMFSFEKNTTIRTP